MFSKRALAIRKRFKLTLRMVQERNLLWFAPPLVDLQGSSLGMFHEWHPLRQASADLLQSPVVQVASAPARSPLLHCFATCSRILPILP